MNYSSVKLLGRLWKHISIKRHRQLKYLLVLMLITSAAEVISIGAVVPFLGVLTNPSAIFNNPIMQPFVIQLGLHMPSQLLLPLTMTFVFAVLLAGSMRLLLLWITTRLSYAIGADLSFDIYKRTLEQPYAVHVSRNSSEVINGITTKANTVIVNIILPLLFVISSVGLLVAILLVLFVIDPVISLISISCFGLLYIVIALFSRKRLLINGQHIATESTLVIKTLQEGLGGIRDIIIDGTQNKFSREYRKADLQLRYSQGGNIFLSQSPRFGMESFGMALIGILAYFLTVRNNVENAVPILGVMALGAQRMLPLFQRLYVGWASLQGGLASLGDTLELLDQPRRILPKEADCFPMPFNHSIRFDNIGFRYSQNTPWVLKEVNLEITKGNRVGVIGSTGSGKTTLTDILMGLLQPSEGGLYIDGVCVSSDNMGSWQKHIAHVPQNIYLADCSIRENIAFGIDPERIDDNRVKCVAEQAQISSLIESWDRGYDTVVGERGARLSGGQLQRIGIARALYKQSDIIIFDEATSALDDGTEESVMQAIDRLSKDLTIIMVAHRLSTLRHCSFIIKLNKSHGEFKLERVLSV